MHGISDDLTSCKGISSGKLKGLLRRHAVTHRIVLRKLPPPAQSILVLTVQHQAADFTASLVLPPAVKQVLQTYSNLFQEPSALPPQRADDHHIPLIPRAQPVNIRPCRYSPRKKTEIER